MESAEEKTYYDCSGNQIVGDYFNDRPYGKESVPFYLKRDAQIRGSQGYFRFNTCNFNSYINVDSYYGFNSEDLGINTAIIDPNNVFNNRDVEEYKDSLFDDEIPSYLRLLWEEETVLVQPSEKLFSFWNLNEKARNRAIIEHIDNSKILVLSGAFNEHKKTKVIEDIILNNDLFSYQGILMKADFDF